MTNKFGFIHKSFWKNEEGKDKQGITDSFIKQMKSVWNDVVSDRDKDWQVNESDRSKLKRCNSLHYQCSREDKTKHEWQQMFKRPISLFNVHKRTEELDIAMSSKMSSNYMSKMPENLTMAIPEDLPKFEEKRQDLKDEELMTKVDKIRVAIPRKLNKELGSKSIEQLQRECMNEQCCKDSIAKLKSSHGKDEIKAHVIEELLSGCAPLRRIEIVLHTYSQLLKHLDIKTWPKQVRLEDFLIVDLGTGEYGHQQIFDDFQHVNRYHIMKDNDAIRARDRDDEEMDDYFEIGKGLCQYFEGEGVYGSKNNELQNLSCDCQYAKNIQHCVAFTRHYRERNKGITGEMTEEEKKQQEEKIIKEQRLYVDKEPIMDDQPQLAEETNNEIALQQECDRIHCFFLQLSHH